MSALKFREDKEEGFTLIELLVVVIIIGILAAIAIPTFLNQRRNGWQAELTSSVRNTALDIEAATTTNNGTVLPATGSNQPPTGVNLTGDSTTTWFYAVDTTADTWCLAGQSTRDLPGIVVYSSGSGITPYAAGTTTLGCTP